jgi:multiple sugar transport system permease protein
MRGKIGILLISPVLLLILFFYGYPLFDLIRSSFFVTRAGVNEYVGLFNYQKVLSSNLFYQAVVNSLRWTGLSLAIQLSVPLILALALNQRFWGNSLARVLMLVPWIIPTVVVAIMLRWLLEPNVGLINHLLLALGIIREPIDFLGRTQSAFLTLVCANSWQFLPFGTLLVLAGLQTIPRDVLEAAWVDGAGAWQRFRYIIFPLLGPVIGFVFFLAFVWNFNTLGLIWLTTQGGPLNATLTLPVLIYRRAFRGFAMGEAAVMGSLASVALMIVGVLYLKYLWKRPA